LTTNQKPCIEKEILQRYQKDSGTRYSTRWQPEYGRGEMIKSVSP